MAFAGHRALPILSHMPCPMFARLVPLWLLLTFLTACGGSDHPDLEGADSADASLSLERPGGASEAQERVVLFLGNSLSAGYGLDPELAFPALIQERIDSLGWPFRVINAGLSGETTAGGLRRADWLFRQRVDILVLELGGNDGLRGILPQETRSNLQGIIDLARERNPDIEIVLAGMQMPPNLGTIYTRAFREVFPDVAQANGIHLIPFLLDGVGGIAELNQRDGIHPTAEGHRIVAENVWAVLGPVLRGVVAPAS